MAPPAYKCPFVSPFFGIQQTRTGGNILTCGEINGQTSDHECAFYNEVSEECMIREDLIQNRALTTYVETVLGELQDAMVNANNFFDSQ